MDPDELEEEEGDVEGVDEFLQEKVAVDAEIDFEPADPAVEPPTQPG